MRFTPVGTLPPQTIRSLHMAWRCEFDGACPRPDVAPWMQSHQSSPRRHILASVALTNETASLRARARARARRHPGAKGPGQSLLPPPWEHALGRIATTVVSTGAACIAALASEFCVVARRHHGVLSAAQVQTSCPGARAPATCGYIQQCVASSPAHWWKLSVRQGVPDPAQATRGRQLPMPS